jgi:hypothetical protein
VENAMIGRSATSSPSSPLVLLQILLFFPALLAFSNRANLKGELTALYSAYLAGSREGTSWVGEGNATKWQGRPLKSCGILTRSGRYVLEQDVSSPKTCFSIQADNVTLNLNGHTITYGTNQGTIAAYGILGVACWDRQFGTGNPCGGTFNNLTVYGGSITQGPGAAAFSDGIRLGQGPGNGLTVHDMTFSIHADSSIPIYSTFLGTRATVYNTTIYNEVTVIQNRHQEQGQSVKFADSAHIPGPAAIYGNHITGGAQGGIFSEVAGTKIQDNFVSQKGTYTNDFGIYAWADNGEVFNNTVTPILGRGIQIASSKGEKVHDNKIVVIEQRDNQEYNGCQPGGAYGIQFDEEPKQATAFRNTVVAKADQCDAQALRVTDSRAGSGNLSRDNQYLAERIGKSTALATGFGTGGATEFTSERDTFVGDSSAVAFDWDGGQNLVFRDCTFGKGSNPAADFVTFAFRNGGNVPVRNIHFVDSIFENGARANSTNMTRTMAEGDWPGPAEYFVDWTLRLTVADQKGNGIRDAAVEIKDAFGKVAFRGTTDREGKISAVLTEFRIYNDPSDVHKENHTPHSLRIGKAGCRPAASDILISMTEKRDQTIQIDCRTP